jgi:hypothetical protein
MTDAYERGTVVDVVVTGRTSYGVLVNAPSGEPGWIESGFLDDVAVRLEDWPQIGTVLTAVVLGPRTRDGRWRFCARPSYVASARAAQDPS